MQPTTVHNVMFYKPIPEGIKCMALNKTESKLAVSRSNFSIEIWNLKYSPYIERVIPSIPQNDSIEGLSWCNGRLFSVGLHGFLIEYDLRQLTIKHLLSITGEQAYCIDSDQYNKNIAIGTENGYINIFEVDEDVVFRKFLDKQEGRILCLKYHESGKFMVTGGENAIRVWNVETGHALHKMTTGRVHNNKGVIVWCLHVFTDMTIVTGDSSGRLIFWDGTIGAQIKSYKSHKADIVALCTSDDEKSLFCAGVDPIIVKYVLVNKGENNWWVRNIQRRLHDHDVLSLILHGEKLYSGGIDGHLCSSVAFPYTIVKFPPILNNCVKVCLQAKYILLCYGNYLEVWKLGQEVPLSGENIIQGKLPLLVRPRRLLVLQRTYTGDENQEIKEGIVCYSMSDDGKWIVFSTDSITRLWKFSYGKSKEPKIMHVKNLPQAVQVYFSADSSQIFLALRTGNVEIYSLDDNDVTMMQTIETAPIIEDTVAFLTGSSCGLYLIVADCKSNIVVWKYKNNVWSRHWKIPKHQAPPVAIAMKPVCNNVVCAYADQKVVECDLKMKSFSAFSKRLKTECSSLFLNSSAIRNITFDSTREDVILLHDVSNIYVIDPHKTSSKTPAKSIKLESSEENKDVRNSYKQLSCKVIDKYKHNAYTEWSPYKSGLIIVQVDPDLFMQQLPPCLQKKAFGTS